MGRGLLKWGATAVALVFSAFVADALGGVAHAIGVYSFAEALVRRMSGLDLVGWLIFLAGLSGGIAITLHGEWLLRWLTQRKRLHNAAQIVLSFGDDLQSVEASKVGLAFQCALDGQIFGRIHVSEPQISDHAITLLLVFADPIPGPQAYVASDRTLPWREVSSSDRHIALEIDLLVREPVTLTAIIRPSGWARLGRWAPKPLQWEDSTKVATEHVKEPIVPPSWKDWLLS